MTIVYDQQPSGQCPVEAEGTINGKKFYFKSRGEVMRLWIASKEGVDPLSEENPINHWEFYHGVHATGPFGAGYAEPQECLDFIVRAAKILLKEDKQ